MPAALAVLLALPLQAGDRAPAPFSPSPLRTPAPLVPEVQTDGFSCGYHALSAVYRAYGLDPALANLRARLGTSVPAIPFVSDSTGTLQPDLFRVLQQDGFYADSVAPRSARERRRLVDHLQAGHYALALLETERAGGLHWVVFTDCQDDLVTVGDSLHRGLQQEDLNALADGPLLSTILLWPGTPAPGSPYFGAHAHGLVQMALTLLYSLPLAISIPLVLLTLLTGIFVIRRMMRLLLRPFRKRPAS